MPVATGPVGAVSTGPLSGAPKKVFSSFCMNIIVRVSLGVSISIITNVKVKVNIKVRVSIRVNVKGYFSLFITVGS